MYILVPALLLIELGFINGLSNQCGNSACCQSANYGQDFSGPYSIFNVANIGYGQSYSVAPNAAGYNCRRTTSLNTCLNTKALPVSLQELYCRQPAYLRIVDDGPVQRQIDNVCVTFFPLPDNPDTFITYDSIVYSDGTSHVSSWVITDEDIGVLRRSTSSSSITQKFFASAGGDLLVGCTRSLYGDNNEITKLFASTFTLAPLTAGCVAEVARLVSCSGISNNGLYVLPYNYPPRCVTQQPCFTNSTLFSF